MSRFPDCRNFLHMSTTGLKRQDQFLILKENLTDILWCKVKYTDFSKARTLRDDRLLKCLVLLGTVHQTSL